jgi:glycosyltransferase 2 family protein
MSEDNIANGSLFTRRIFNLRNTTSILLTLVVLYLVYQEMLDLDWRGTWVSVRGASVGHFVLGFAIFYCSFPLRAWRWETLLGNVGYGRAAVDRIPSPLGLTKIMYLACFTNCLTIARLGDAYRSYLLKKVAGVSFLVTLGTVLAERFLDTFVLTMMLGAGLLVIFHESWSMEATEVLAAGLVLTTIGIVGLLSMPRLRGAIERFLPKRLHAHYARLEHGVIGSFRRFPLLVIYSVFGWVIEGAALYTIAAAVGAPVSVAGALVVALTAALLTTVPFTPAGFGFTEGGMLIILQWLGLDVYTASAVTLLFRLINYWSIVVFGFVLYLSTRSRNRTNEESLVLDG